LSDIASAAADSIFEFLACFFLQNVGEDGCEDCIRRNESIEMKKFFKINPIDLADIAADWFKYVYDLRLVWSFEGPQGQIALRIGSG
jgi:hypothetical protein